MLLSGRTLQNGKYRIDAVLGQGGFGITYRATWIMATRPVLRQKTVAVKEYFPRQIVYRDTISGEVLIPGEVDHAAYEYGLQQFLREGEFLHGSRYPSVVTVHDIFEDNNTAYLVMEFLEGQSLAAELRQNNRRGLPEDRVRNILDQLVSALAALHDAGVYHLDIKPANIMCCSDGRVVLIDFGAAKQGTNKMSQSLVAFSPAYAPPEIFGRGSFGPETDLFELGMVAHELLTGEVPASAIERLSGTHWEPSTLREPWRAMVQAATELNREHRPADIRAWWRGSQKPGESSMTAVSGTVQVSSTAATEEAASDTLSERAETRSIRRNPVDGAEMVWIPGGEFIMGSEDRDRDGRSNERPQRLVYLDGFWMYRQLVTVKQFQAFVEAMQAARVPNPDGHPWEMPPPPPFNPDWVYKDHPIVNVSWFEAAAYAGWVGGVLPSEAQWEKAARGTDGRLFPWGNEFDESRVWSSVEVRREETAPVSRTEYTNESPFGVLDTVGNVWEWCRDWFDPAFYQTAPFRNPVLEDHRSGWRVLRGGSWADSMPRLFRTTLRAWDHPDYGYVYRGFRVACNQ
ncbi:MAG: hypothetical protein OHK0029_10570 [Armatimonadaceae bacterium]